MPSTFTRSALIPADLGATLPRYDLFGRERAEQARLNGFNSMLSQVAAPLSACLSQLFNNADCELRLSPFVAAAQPDGEEQRVWLQARAAGASVPLAWFAITPATLYRLAILFFGAVSSPALRWRCRRIRATLSCASISASAAIRWKTSPAPWGGVNWDGS
ncbi:hypothetical protein [Aeromonas schubertii]|uniref:hypothetical protein n=1 Tax=Aeromonas schubertii TaxID=652 RepID=UPI0010A8C5A5|nr:hypothetical protein [Aeromonas schubertii]QCG49407.1 hypothetical protein E2P79_17630 [Aeromonas schubertii]